MTTLTLACHAMATRFEIVLQGENPVALRAAGEEALEEVQRLEDRLSLFRPTSEIANVNARAARAPVRVTPEVFALLQHARRLNLETGGAFDITIAPLVQCWGFMGGSGRLPSPGALEEARARVGMRLVQLDPESYSVRFDREGVMLDLGAIGKGYAVERAAEILREAGVTSALLHGGTSTVYALGHPDEAPCWKIAVGRPQNQGGVLRVDNSLSASELDGNTLLATIPLTDCALSVSAIWGKCFESGGKTLGHILDPRTGHPAGNAVLSAVILPSATETDALSTALLIAGGAGHATLAKLRPEMKTLLVVEAAGEYTVEAQGIETH